MTVRADSGVASFLILKKTVQNSSKRNQGVASFLIPKSFHIEDEVVKLGMMK
jgi:hypothetical protein